MGCRIWGVAVFVLALFAVGCGGDETDEEDPEPTRCGGVHWNEAEGRDGYTGCQGNDGDWLCECGTAPSQAFQGETTVTNESASLCAGAVRESCGTQLEWVAPCAGVSGPATCWRVEGDDDTTAAETFACRCERGVSPMEVSGDSCVAALEASCP